jgi:hypothetical protein
MPKNWLDSKLAPDPPVLDWLKWTAHDLERHTISGTVAAIIGLNKMGDLQTIFSPIVIQNAFNNGEHSAIIGNSSNKSNKPAFIYTDASDIGSIMVVMTYDDIPSELRPEEPLLSMFIADTCWAAAKVKLGMVHRCLPPSSSDRRLLKLRCTMLTLRTKWQKSPLSTFKNGPNLCKNV